MWESGEADDWPPDGEQIVFDSQRSGNPDIYIMNADGTDQQQPTDNPAKANASEPLMGYRNGHNCHRKQSVVGSVKKCSGDLLPGWAVAGR